MGVQCCTDPNSESTGDLFDILQAITVQFTVGRCKCYQTNFHTCSLLVANTGLITHEKKQEQTMFNDLRLDMVFGTICLD